MHVAGARGGDKAPPPTPLSALPCALRFGPSTGPAEGDVEACRYHFEAGMPAGVDLRPAGGVPAREAELLGRSRACWAWCEGSASAAHANASLVMVRRPAAPPPRRRGKRAEQGGGSRFHPAFKR